MWRAGFWGEDRKLQDEEVVGRAGGAGVCWGRRRAEVRGRAATEADRDSDIPDLVPRAEAAVGGVRDGKNSPGFVPVAVTRLLCGSPGGTREGGPSRRLRKGRGWARGLAAEMQRNDTDVKDGRGQRRDHLRVTEPLSAGVTSRKGIEWRRRGLGGMSWVSL